MACSADRERKCGGRGGVSGLLANRGSSAREPRPARLYIPALVTVVKESLRGWLVARLAIWFIAPFLFTGVGWWLDSLLLSGFKAAVFVALAVAWFVDFEFGRFRQREYVANLGFGRTMTIGLALLVAFLAEISFFLIVKTL